jgi:hypothetical protein
MVRPNIEGPFKVIVKICQIYKVIICCISTVKSLRRNRSLGVFAPISCMGNKKCFFLSFPPTAPLLINFTVIFTKKKKKKKKNEKEIDL